MLATYASSSGLNGLASPQAFALAGAIMDFVEMNIFANGLVAQVIRLGPHGPLGITPDFVALRPIYQGWGLFGGELG